MNKRIGLILSGVAAAAVMAGGTAYGAVASSQSIPDSSGVIHGCYSANGATGTNGTQLKIIDSTQASCSKRQTAITWNQTGAQGPQGPAGAQGPQGPAGTNAAPAYTWTGTCTPGGATISCYVLSTHSVPAGTVLTPETVTATGGCSVDAAQTNLLDEDQAGQAEGHS